MRAPLAVLVSISAKSSRFIASGRLSKRVRFHPRLSFAGTRRARSRGSSRGLASGLLPAGLTALHPVGERPPGRGGEDERLAVGVLGVPDAHRAGQVACDLDAVACTAAVAALAPRGLGKARFHISCPLW